MKRLVFLAPILFVGLLPAQTQTATSVVASADEKAVRTLVGNFNNAFNAHDVKAFGAVFATDADFTNWLGMSAHGRANIETFHVPVLTVMYKNGTQKVLSSNIRFIRPDVAAVDVRSEVTGGLTPDGKAAPLMKFLLNWTVTKEPNGQWLIKVMHNNRLPEMPAPLLNPGSAQPTTSK